MAKERQSEELNRSTAFDNRLRPTDFDGFVGQGKVRDRLLLAVKAAKDRGESLDHVLFSGPPGLGKTTLSYILGEAMGVNVKTTSGPVITKPGDLAGLLTSLEPGDIVKVRITRDCVEGKGQPELTRDPNRAAHSVKLNTGKGEKPASGNSAPASAS